MSSHSIFPQFIDETRVWIYGFTHSLTNKEKRIVEHTLQEFVGEWKTHGQAVTGDFVIWYNKFAILGGESADGLSGCSIDSSVRIFKKLNEDHGLDALDQGLIHYRIDTEILSVNRIVFQDLVNKGTITDDTIVFNNTIQTVGEIRRELWETKLTNSWHAQAFRLSA